jgi:Raf kinase inhibitor-like YbhB/YbcL family protein
MSSRRAWVLGCCALLLADVGVFARPVVTIGISSPDFAPGQPIPARYASTGQNISPELRLESVPATARSLVLIVDDPDSPSGPWTHWLVWNLPADTTSIPEGKLPPDARVGRNSFGNVRYDGPAPPNAVHRYFFRIYALDEPFLPKFRTASPRDEMLAEMDGHIVGTGEMFGTYAATP